MNSTVQSEHNEMVDLLPIGGRFEGSSSGIWPACSRCSLVMGTGDGGGRASIPWLPRFRPSTISFIMECVGPQTEENSGFKTRDVVTAEPLYMQTNSAATLRVIPMQMQGHWWVSAAVRRGAISHCLDCSRRPSCQHPGLHQFPEAELRFSTANTDIHCPSQTIFKSGSNAGMQ